jgi:hypothetical protein
MTKDEQAEQIGRAYVQGYDEGKAAGEARVTELVNDLQRLRGEMRRAACDAPARETYGGPIVRLDGDSVLLEAIVKGFDIGDRVRLVKV